ncbi:MAG: DUF4912 domain-containing protein, partial [Pyrinomonadaceae bacterium]
MEKKVVKKKSAVKKTTGKTAKETVVSADPFDAVAVPAVNAAPNKRAIKVIKADRASEKVIEVPSEEKRSKPARAVKQAATKVIEPFAEIAVESSPVKKRVAEAAEKTADVVRAKAKPAKEKSVKSVTKSKKADLTVTAELATTGPEVELSPAFEALADVKLPELQRDNRARLLMQSPTKLYFYWSTKANPWHQLKNVFPDDLGGYVLALKLKNITRDSELIHQCEATGNWWFDVEPDCEYQAEIGFYAVNRPYFRVIYSNTITTPRRSPSTRPATEARWTVSATKFAEVLDASGFSRDAADVAMAGDDQVA